MIAIINYGMGNLTSVKKALDALAIPSIITNEESVINDCTHIILPGVGSFRQAMENLNATGLIPVLTRNVQIGKKPFLGICLGMQLLAEKGFEEGETPGLGYIAGEIIPFAASALPVTHIGWNNIEVKNNVLFTEVDDFNFYFVHSYYFNAADDTQVAATVHYGSDITAAVRKANVFGTQFHPEKSQKEGLKILKNFYAYA